MGTTYPMQKEQWADGVTIKKLISAPKYVDHLMEWIETQLDNESIFPQKLGAPFPQNFQDVVKTIFKQLFRIKQIETVDKAFESDPEKHSINDGKKHLQYNRRPICEKTVLDSSLGFYDGMFAI
ncbi:MOB kinase activator-like 1A protein [Tanacetum coccineum]